MFVARKNAFLAGCSSIESHHLLSALLAGQDPEFAALLDQAGVSRDRLVSALGRVPATPPTEADARREIPFSDEFKGVLSIAQEEADALSNATIGSGHLLLALLRAEEGSAGGVLTSSGGRAEAVRLALRGTV